MDIRTLLGTVVIVQLCCALGLGVIGRDVKGLGGLRWFESAYLCTALGLGWAFWMASVNVWAQFGARCLVMVAAVLMTQGVAEFVSARANMLPWGAAAWVTCCSLDLVCVLTHREALAPAVFCTFFSVQLILAALVLLSRQDPVERFAVRAAAVLMSGMAVVCLGRAVVSPFRDLPANPFAPDPVRFIGLTFFMLFSAGTAFALIGMVTVRLRQQLEHEARTDALTGMLNRRALEAAMTGVIAGCRARGRALAVIAVDLDHFKRINDAHGHGGGDAVLRAVATALAQGVRDTDLVARVGGEEFMLVLPTRGATETFRVAERLRQGLEAMAVPFGAATLGATASFGVATLDHPGEDWSQLFRRADRWLYAAKQDGRNRTRGEGDPHPAPAAAAPLAGAPRFAPSLG